MIRRLFCLSVTVVFLLASQGISCAQALTVEEAVRIALQNNYSILIAKTEGEIAGNNVSWGNAGFLPGISADFSNNNGINNTNLQFANGSSQERRGAKVSSLNGGIALNWTIFDGFAMFAQYERLRTLSEIERFQLKETMEQTVLEVQRNYHAAYLQMYIARSLQESMDIYQDITALIKLKTEVGAASQFDLMQAQLEFNTFKSAYLNQIVELENAKIALNEAMGRTPQTSFEIADSIAIKGRIEQQQVDLLGNNFLAIARQNKSLALSNLEISRSLRYPTLGVNAGYNYIKTESQAGFVLFNQTSGFNYGFTVSWNIFNGFNQHRIIQNSKLALQATDLEYQRVKLQLDSRLAQYYKNYNNNLEILEIESENIKIAEQMMDLAIERYRLGLMSLFELKDAQRTFLNAQNRFVDALYKTKISELELLKLDGRIIEVRK